MARVTVEDCLQQVPNRFALVLLAATRTKQILKGSKPRVQTANKEIVLALREIAAGKVNPIKPKGRLLQEKAGEEK
jgi:DNA-directed RNA polymerase subunit omega